MLAVRLSEISIQGFQSYRDQQVIRVEPHVTLLAGRNNVGKSALLRALQFSRARQDGTHEDFALKYKWRVPADELLKGLGRSDADWKPVADWVTSQPEHELHARFVYGSGALTCVQIDLPMLHATAQGSPGTKIGWSHGGLRGGAFAVDEFVTLVSTAAGQVVSATPRRLEHGLRNLVPTSQLMPDGRNLAEVLMHLQLNEPTTTYRALSTFVETAFPDVELVSVGTSDGQGSVPMGEPQVHFRGRSQPVPLRLCGTGIEQLLSLAVAVLGARGPHLFLIDEPQAYLHPHAERSLQVLLNEHPEHQYIIATHSHVLLRSRPLSQARLITLVDGATCVTEVEDDSQVLDELGVTAADLWLADRILWVEGPTEVAVLGLLAEKYLTATDRLTMTIKNMPEAASRFAGSGKKIRNAYKFCEEIVSAIAPLDVGMIFLFDRDEKTDEQREAIINASGDRARFLDVREIENYFLDPDLIRVLIAERCDEDHGLPTPTLTTIEGRLDQLLGSFENAKLFPGGEPDDLEPWRVVRGSQVLDALLWEFTNSLLDKVQDGLRLAEIALATKPTALGPLREVLRDL
jgi:hypothetical protein